MTGPNWRTMARLTTVWKARMVKSDPERTRAKRELARKVTSQTRKKKRANRPRTRRDPDETPFFADDGEDEVGLLLGDSLGFDLVSVHVAESTCAATGKGDFTLGLLEEVVVQVFFPVDEGIDGGCDAGLGVIGDEAGEPETGDGGDDNGEGDREVLGGDSGIDGGGEGDADQAKGGSVVGLKENEGDQRGHVQKGSGDGDGGLDGFVALGEIGGDGDGEHHFREFAGVEIRWGRGRSTV